MNDELSPGSGTFGTDALTPAAVPAAPSAADGPPGAGGLIRAARLAQGMDLASLAAMLKIPLRKLEALETGRHEELQGPTFERALAQAACRVLKIDPKPVLALMPQVAGNTLEHVTGGLNKPFRERQARGADPDVSLLRSPVAAVVAVLALGALALFFLPETFWKRVSAPVVAAFASPAAPAASAPAAAVTPAAGASEAVADAAAPAGAGATAAETASADTAAGPASAAAAPAVDEVLAHAAPPPNIPLQVSASADSWIEVLDAQGRTLLSRTVVAGESVGLDGAMPMRVKVGNALGTKLTLRGENVDLVPYTRDNVARLELK